MSPRSMFRVGALWIALFGLLLPWTETPGAESNIGKQVTLIFKDKSRAAVSGTLVEDGKERVAIQTGDATRTFQKSDIERIVLKKPVEEEFKERVARCKTADEFVALAKWCGQPDVKLPRERGRCLDEAIKLSPDHAAARTELGQVKVDGQWVDEEEHKRKLGYVEGPDGKLYPPDEAKRLWDADAIQKAEKSGQAKGLTKRLKQDEGIPWAVAKVLRDKNYILKCNAGDESSKRYLQVLNSLNRRYSELFKEFTPFYTGPGNVFIFRNREEFFDFTMNQRGTGGFFRFDDRSVRAYHGSFGPTGSTDMVLAHEATHQFQHRIMKEMRFVPNWLIEGMAVYFGDGSKISPSNVEVGMIPRDRFTTLREEIDSNRYLKLAKLLTLPPGRIEAYHCGWGIIFWCLQGNNPKYKFGHKGEGKKVWDQYLRHVALELNKPTSFKYLEEEAKFFTDLLLKETKATSIEKWEEGYKQFILNLPLEPLGKWNGKLWDGSAKTGLQITVTDKFQPVEEKALRQAYREAAAAVTADGARLWVMVEGKWGEDEPEQILENFIQGTFIDKEFDEEFEEEEVRAIKVNGILDAVESSFKGKIAPRRESGLRGGGEPGEKDGSGKKTGKAATASKKDPSALVIDELQRVRVTMIHTLDRIYFITLNGPEGAFAKVEPYFEEILNSVKVNLLLGK